MKFDKNKINKILERFNYYSSKLFHSEFLSLLFLISLKIFFQIILLSTGFRWLSADDYCRTVISYNWLQKPEISSGVWLPFHFWLNGFFMMFIRDLFVAATVISLIFSTLSLFFFFKSIEIAFNRRTAFWSSVIFIFFPFQAWLGISGLPEPIFFFFILGGLYFFLLWKTKNQKRYLFLAAVSIALSNGFRYEGWLFSITLIILVSLDFFKEKKFSKLFFINILIASVSLITIIWWLILNYIDNKDFFYFAKETSKIYENLNTAKYLQKIIQYPTFIFYIAPITSFFSIKVIYSNFRKKELNLTVLFLLYNIIELTLLIIQGIIGTGGTNMISRYIVINALLFIPPAVEQFFNYKKGLTVLAFTGTILTYLIWCFFYPQPFREDTFEVGYALRNSVLKNLIEEKDKIYFEEIEGYFDVFAIQTLSNQPDRFILGSLPELTVTEKKSKKKKSALSDEELNILDIKKFIDKNDIGLAIVKSSSYNEKLRKISVKKEEIGDYNLFYFRDIKSNFSDSTVNGFSNKIKPLRENPDVINFGKIIAIKNLTIDNVNFGMNPQTVSVDWYAVNKGIIDSLDYEEYEFDRYQAVVELTNPDNDSLVHSEVKNIFSARNIEDLIEKNEIKTIIILKPFALLQYSLKNLKSPFESGIYNMSLKVRDNKYGNDLIVFKGDSLFNYFRLKQKSDNSDTLLINISGSSIVKDSINYSYNLGDIIAMFPNTDYNKLFSKKNSDIFQVIMRNGFQIFFSQRYTGDHFLNFVFSYF